MHPELSIVVGVYNSAAYLRSSLESVLAQTTPHFELIAINDGSSDSSLQILKQLAAADERVRIIDQENRGLTRALITGCAAARGEFIARHDADDVSLTGRFAEQLKLFRDHSELAIVSCFAQAVGPLGEPLYEIRRPSNRDIATHLLRTQRQGPSHHGTVMFPRSAYAAVGGYRKEFYFAQDSDLWLRLIDIGPIAYVPKLLYSFRISPHSISSAHRLRQNRLGELAHACRAARLAGSSEADLLEQAAAIRPTPSEITSPDSVSGNYFIGRCLLRRRDRRARRYLWAVISSRPWAVRAWMGVAQTLLLDVRGSVLTPRSIVSDRQSTRCDGAR